MLLVMLLRMSTVLRTFTLALSEESVQCPVGLFFVIP